MNKKDISMAVMATILVLQLIGSIFGGIPGKVATGIADALQNRIQIEKILNEEGLHGYSD